MCTKKSREDRIFDVFNAIMKSGKYHMDNVSASSIVKKVDEIYKESQKSERQKY